MSVSNNSLLGSQAAGNKSNQLLAVLSTDNGAGNRLGPDFSEMLRNTFIPPSVPTSQLTETAPAPKETAPRALEQARNSEQKPAPAQNSQPHAQAPRSNDSTASSHDAAQSGKAKQVEDAPDAQDSVQTGKTDVAKAKKDKQLGQSATAADITGLSVAAIPIGIADPKAAMLAQAQKPMIATENRAPDADATGPQDLASLMPSVAQAVFGQDAGKQAVGEGKSDGEAVPTSTDERGKVMSAKAHDLVTLLAGQTPASDDPLKDLSATSPELLKSFGFDKTSSGDQPSFGKLMQAAGAVASPLTAPVNGAATGTQALAPSTPVQMKSDLHGPAFAPEMAARLTVLTGAGVQKAELHLSPAEMGPVSVQIHLNGQEAQVNFHAQHALTREVLERSLPELAAALRDAGMTLTGGGVFQQSNGARQDGQAQGPQVTGQSLSTIGPEFGDGAAAPMTVRHTQVGVLDMYA